MTCVSRLRFAKDAQGKEVGYAYGPGLAMTKDDAKTWTTESARS